MGQLPQAPGRARRTSSASSTSAPCPRSARSGRRSARRRGRANMRLEGRRGRTQRPASADSSRDRAAVVLTAFADVRRSRGRSRRDGRRAAAIASVRVVIRRASRRASGDARRTVRRVEVEDLVPRRSSRMPLVRSGRLGVHRGCRGTGRQRAPRAACPRSVSIERDRPGERPGGTSTWSRRLDETALSRRAPRP